MAQHFEQEWLPRAHKDVLGELVEWWEDATNGRNAFFVRLATPEDWGVERVLRALTNALVSAQPDDEQFFEHLSPGESALSVRDPSAFPSFVAFGVSCASGIKAVQPDLIEFQKQLSEWQDDLRAADSLETNRGRRLAGLDQLQSAAEILATAVGATVVGAGLTLAGAVRGQYQSSADFKRRFNIYSLESRRTDRCAHSLAFLSRRAPLLVTVQDADLASREFVEFLTELLDQPDARILVVLACESGVEVEWAEKVRARVPIYSIDVSEVTPRVLRSEIQGLAGSSGNAAFVEAAAGRFESLGALTRFADTPAVWVALEAGALSTSEIVVWRDPAKTLDTMLKEDGRVLAAAAVVGPLVPTIWLDQLETAHLSDSLGRLVMSGWLRETTTDMFRFASESVRLSARDRATRYLTVGEWEALELGAAEALRAALEPEQASSDAALWHLAERAAQVDDPPTELIQHAAAVATLAGAYRTASILYRAHDSEFGVDPSGVVQRIEAIVDGNAQAADPISIVVAGLLRLSFTVTGWEQTADQVAAALGEMSATSRPDDLASWWFELGERLAEHGHVDRAQDAASRAAALTQRWEAKVRAFIESLSAGFVYEQRLLDRLESEYSEAVEARVSPESLDDLHDEAGRLALELGHWKQGIWHWEMVATIRDRVLGTDHPHTEIAQMNLGLAYFQDGRFGEAITQLERIVPNIEGSGVHTHSNAPRTRINLGPADLNATKVRMNLGLAYLFNGRVREAISILEQVVPDFESGSGPDHHDTLRARMNLGLAYLGDQRPTEAISILEQVVPDFESRSGPDHHETIKARMNLGLAYLEDQRTNEAISILEQVVPDFESGSGPDHHETIKARMNLGRAYHDDQRTNEAISILEQVVSDFESNAGVDHPDTVGARAILARTYRDDGRIKDAVTLGERVLTQRERTLGADHQYTMAARAILARTYRDDGRINDAVTLGEQILTGRERTLGADHPDTITSREMLAWLFVRAERVRDAVTLFEQAVIDRERTLGVGHPDTIAARSLLANLAKLIGESETPSPSGSRSSRTENVSSEPTTPKPSEGHQPRV
jgi:tetratricopeptide (TPR) repeat protein